MSDLRSRTHEVGAGSILRIGDNKPRRRRLRVAMIAAADYDIDARIRRQAEALVSRGDEVVAVVLGDGKRETTVVRDGVNVVQLPVPKYRGSSMRAYLWTYIRFWLRAFMWLSRRPRAFDIVQVHSMPEALVFCATLPRLLGIPVLLDVHDLTSELFGAKFQGGRRTWLRSIVRASERTSMRFATETMTVHEHYAGVIRELHGAAARGLRAVVNAPDEGRFTDHRWRPWKDDILFSFHGTLVHRYGVINMLEAFAKVRTDIPGSRLQILGDGDARTDIVMTIERLGLQDAVTISPGRVPVEDMPRLIGEAHIGLAPNLLDPFTEGILPTKVLEYAALGIPVVASRLPVLAGYFDELAVRYVEPGDTASLAQAMLETALDPEQARIRAGRAYERLREISWAKQQRVYLSVVDRLAAAHVLAKV